MFNKLGMELLSDDSLNYHFVLKTKKRLVNVETPQGRDFSKKDSLRE